MGGADPTSGEPERAVAPFATSRLAVRVADREDAAALQDVIAAGADHFVRTEGAPPEADAADRLLDEAEADDRRVVLLVAPRAGGPAIGLVDLHLGTHEPDAAHVGLLLLRGTARGMGHGREVMDALEEALARAGWAALRLSVGDENPEARGFWESLGFAECARLDRGVTVFEKALG